MNWRDTTYRGLRLSNDWRAMRRGRFGQRLLRRLLGRAAGRAIGRTTR